MVSLIIPAYNEQRIIKDTVQKAMGFLERNTKDFELIVVDDGSKDKTCEVLISSGATVISLPYNMGKGAAVKEGVSHARGDFIFFTDADMPYSLDFITDGVSILGGCDIVCGARFGHYPLRRRLVSAAYNKFVNKTLGIDLCDVQCGIKGFTRSSAMKIFPLCRIEGFAFDTEIVFLARQLQLDIKTINVSISHRKESTVSLLGDGLEMFADVINIRNRFEAGEYNFLKSYQR